MKAYTRKGDLGCTHDYSGKKIPKDDIQIVCWGKVDELQAIIDLAILQSKRKVKKQLNQVQHKLWQTSGEISCSPPQCVIDPVTKEDLTEIEKFIDSLGQPPDHFVRFNTEKAIVLNECRVRCRNLERNLVKMLRKKQIRPVVYKYINRLSSLFFMLAYKKSKKRSK